MGKGGWIYYPTENNDDKEMTISCIDCNKTKTFDNKKEARDNNWVKWTDGQWQCNDCSKEQRERIKIGIKSND